MPEDRFLNRRAEERPEVFDGEVSTMAMGERADRHELVGRLRVLRALFDRGLQPLQLDVPHGGLAAARELA